MSVATIIEGAVVMTTRQLGGTFLTPGSTFSLGALAASLAVCVMVMFHGKRQRPIRAAVLLRAVFPRRLYRSASGRADLILFSGGILFSGLAIGWALIATADVQAAVARWLGPAPPPLLLTGWPAVAAMTLALFLAYEFAYWLDHRLKHAVPLLWQFHKVHHQAESLSLLTNGRVHPVDTIIFYNIVAVVTGTVGALAGRLTGGIEPAAIGGTNALIMLSAIAITHLQHSHLWLRFGARGCRWLLGPARHQIHHSSIPEHFDRNFGNVLTLFDRVFGTFFLPPPRRGAIRFGVDDGVDRPHSLRAMLVTPFVSAGALLVPAAVRRACFDSALSTTRIGWPPIRSHRT